VDPKKSDQTVRGSVVLPAGTGKSVRVAVFAQGEKAEIAKAAGADLVIALLVLTTILWLLIKQTSAKLLSRKIQIFLLISISQGLIGYIQYVTGLPELVVGFHLLGAALVWGSAWSFVKVAGSGFRLKGFN
jgi:hypothetical protein